MDSSTILLIVVLGVPALILFYGISLYNSLVSKKNRVEAGWSQIDVQLKRRYDLIPNLVEVVKDTMSYEQETLREVIEARAKAMAARDESREASIAAEGLLGAALGKLFALSEAYPDLKANQSAMELQEQLTTTENKIAFARQHYNDLVMALNTLIETFPSNFVANMFHFVQAIYFEVPEAETKPVKVDLR